MSGRSVVDGLLPPGALAILATGSLKVMGLKTRTSSYDRSLPDWPVFCRSTALARFTLG